MSQFTPHNLYGIIGYPLGQSLSPLIHTTSFQDHNISAALVPWAIQPDDLDTFFAAFRLLNFRGCCVTIPHKEAVIPFLDEITPRAKSIGAVNHIYWKDDKLCGDNTDIIGFMAPLIGKPIKKALILGAGGAARAAIVGLRELGCEDINITNVRPASPSLLAQEFNINLIDWNDRHNVDADIIINSSPLGMKGKHEDETGYDAEWFNGRKGIAYDIVYTPYMTRFLSEAQQAGWDIVSGLEMFIEQAEAQFKNWTGKNLSSNSRQIVVDALGK